MWAAIVSFFGVVASGIAEAIAWLSSSWLGRLFLKEVKRRATRYFKFILGQISESWKKSHRDQVQKDAKDDYEEVIKNPKLTAEERAKAYAKYHNSGRS